ncbi:MAG: Rossmann-like and DUF2520 domain-containing protein [Actinomycetota bacterium]
MSTSAPTPKSRVALIGAGRVGTAVAELLRRRGRALAGVSSRRAESAERAAAALGTSVFDHRIALPEADIFLVGAPDGAIAPVASEIAPFLHEGAAVIHFAGALGLAPLGDASAVGAGVAALHPVQSFPDVETALERLPGSAWGVTASEGILRWSEDLITEELEGLAVTVPEAARPTWHAASVSTSNGVAALLATGEAMLASVGIDRPQRVLGPLAAGTVANARRRGGALTLTGPVVRSESATIARHLEALAITAPELVEDYARVARIIVGAALRAQRIADEQAAKMLDLLENAGR